MEKWERVEWFNYEVSNFWNIKSLGWSETLNWRWRGFTRVKKEKILKSWSKQYNYQCIYLCKDWKKYVKMVHRLVAQAFLWLDINNPKIEIWHKDNNPKNNNINNLYLTTHIKNEEYKKICWRTAFWEKNWTARLSEKQVLEIYKKFKDWKRIYELEKEYNHKWIREIVKGRTWKYLYNNFLENEL